MATAAEPWGRPAPAGVGEQSLNEPLLTDLGELAVKAAVAPGGCLRGGDGAVDRPHCSDVRVVTESFRRHIAFGEREAATDIAPVVPRLLPRRVLRLGLDGPRARGTAVIASFEVVENAATRLSNRGQRLLLY